MRFILHSVCVYEFVLSVLSGEPNGSEQLLVLVGFYAQLYVLKRNSKEDYPHSLQVWLSILVAILFLPESVFFMFE